MPIFIESIDGGKISIDQNPSNANTFKTYFQKLSELKLIIQEAAKEFNLDSLHSMRMGNLIINGDLAIIVTKEYYKKFGENKKAVITTNNEISQLLLKPRLANDFNDLFKPYGIVVETVTLEKAYFTTKDVLYAHNKVLKHTTEIPNKILDCTVWIGFKKK